MDLLSQLIDCKNENGLLENVLSTLEKNYSNLLSLFEKYENNNEFPFYTFYYKITSRLSETFPATEAYKPVDNKVSD